LGQVSVVTYSTNDDGSSMRGTKSLTHGLQSKDEGWSPESGVLVLSLCDTVTNFPAGRSLVVSSAKDIKFSWQDNLSRTLHHLCIISVYTPCRCHHYTLIAFNADANCPQLRSPPRLPSKSLFCCRFF